MNDDKDFLKDWLEGKISHEEINTKKEKNDAFVQELDALITTSAKLKLPNSITKEEAWKKLSGKLTETPIKETKIIKLNRWIPVSIAASISLLMVAAFFLFDKTTVASQLAETKTHTLPDGSMVTLNAGSKIQYSTYRWSGNRSVTLEGEGFFNVTKGDRFTVESENATVTVLGTSFNVRARQSDVEVACFTGKVNVASLGKSVLLTKGLFTKLDENGLTSAASFDTLRTTWREGDSYFDRKPFGEVIEELERQFNIEVEYTGDDTRLYTGRFNNKNLDEALKIVFVPMSAQYYRENNKIIAK